MKSIRISLAVAAIGLAISGAAKAGVVDLGIAGAFNVYTLGNFNSQYSDTEGAIAAAGNVTATGYSINANNVDGTLGHSLVAGGNLSYTYGSINNGSYYVGGNISKNGVGFNSATQSGTAPISFEETSNYVKDLSLSLAGLAATGTMSKYYGGLQFAGSGNGNVDIFNISGSSLLTADQFVFQNLTPGQTLIFNISGTEGMGFRPNGVSFNGFSNFNVLFNFYEATKDLSLKGVIGSVLAPLATVKDEYGVINGNVIVGTWNSHVQINANHYFKPTEVAGFGAKQSGTNQQIPEPPAYALIVIGLGFLAFVTRRKLQPARMVRPAPGRLPDRT